MYRVLHALIGMLTVDSNFTNSELEHLATELRGLSSGAGTFVTAPVHYSAGTSTSTSGSAASSGRPSGRTPLRRSPRSTRSQ